MTPLGPSRSGAAPEASPPSPYREPVTTFPVRIPSGKGRAVTIDFINVLTLGTALVPTALVAWLAIFFWGAWVGPFEVILFAVFTVATGLGITLGYHRFFTHGAFETSPLLKRTLGVLGAFTVQGPLLFWCSCHRLHHQHSDHEGDLHSPHLSGGGTWGRIRGLFHAHLGWIVWSGDYRYKAKTVRDLYTDPDVRFVDHYYLYWVFLSLALPALAGGLYHRSWDGAMLGFLAGGVIRIAFVHHVTWAVNSFGHVYGDQSYRTHDESRNNLFLALMGMGDGWHNNHHAFPRSARHGMTWWQLDLTYLVIQILQRIGLVWKVRLIPAEQRAKKALSKTASQAAPGAPALPRSAPDEEA
jgi:stearoyl-CoA desaturase (delta-9 desaturase)